MAYNAPYNRLARLGFATFMRGRCLRLIEQLRLLVRLARVAPGRWIDPILRAIREEAE